MYLLCMYSCCGLICIINQGILTNLIISVPFNMITILSGFVIIISTYTVFDISYKHSLEMCEGK
jgi:hypothetical protein